MSSRRKDHEGDDRHALRMETFRIPCFLSQPHLAERRYGHGKSGPLHYPGVILLGKDAVPGSGGEGHLYGQGQKDKQSLSSPGMAGAMCSHILNKGEQMVRYYGYYSNVSRGERKKEGNDDAVPCILEP